eukprot:765376-Hanusia_phi.AAC.1
MILLGAGPFKCGPDSPAPGPGVRRGSSEARQDSGVGGRRPTVQKILKALGLGRRGSLAGCDKLSSEVQKSFRFFPWPLKRRSNDKVVTFMGSTVQWLGLSRYRRRSY